MDRAHTPLSTKRWWDLPAAFLLLVVLTAGFTRLMATQWTEGLSITRTLTYLGFTAGLALGYSRFSPRVAVLFAAAYGIFAVPWRLGLMMGEGVLWTERIGSLIGRLSVTINQLARQQAVTDNLLFLTLMSALFWALSVHAGYSLTRYANPWRTVLPTGLAMVVIHSYDAYLSRRSWYLVLYLFFALLLVARLVYLQRRSLWEQTKTYIPPHLGMDFIRVATVATILLILFSWTVPALADSLPAAESAWQRIKQPWDAVRDRFDNAFASLRSSVGIVNDYYSSSLSLGRGNRLSDTVLFSVLAPLNTPDTVRLYWRARVFDVYEDGQWQTSLTTDHELTPDTFDLTFPNEEKRAPGEYSFAFNLQIPISTLLAAPQPQWASRPVRAELLFNPDGSADLGSLHAAQMLRAGETYFIRSSLSNVTITDLRQAGEDYPEWVRERYLQLPDSITPRTLELAQLLAGDLETPYDQVAAITTYLRQTIEYTETIPDLPADQELLDWFLFDLEQGFCNYYASAEVILLRSLGIPARLAVGYAQGDVDEITREYVVRQRDAHAWPEVYFPGLGWVEFEPTAGQPDLVRPSGESRADSNVDVPTIDELQDRLDLFRQQQARQSELQLSETSQAGRNIWRLSVAALLLLAMALLFIPMKWKKQFFGRMSPIPILLETGMRRVGIQPPSILRRWARRASLSPLARAYQEINAALNRLGSSPLPSDTPAERVSILSAELPPVREPAQRLLSEYESATYGLQPADIQTARQAGTEIRSISFRALFQRLLRGRNDSTDNLFKQR